MTDASTSPKNNSFWAMFLRGENIVNNEVVFFNEKDLRIRLGGGKELLPYPDKSKVPVNKT